MDYLSVSEAASLKKVTRQAIYLAIQANRLKAYKHREQFRIFRVDLDEYYEKHRFSRSISTYKGELIFDDEKGLISIDRASQMINVPKQKLYYACRTGQLAAHRKKCSWVIDVKDLLRYEKQYLKRDLTHKKAQ